MKSKLNIILVLCFSYFFCSAQRDISSIHITANKNQIELGDFIKELEQKHNLSFSFSSEDIQDLTLDLKFLNENINQVLETICSTKNLEYRIVGNNVLLRKKSIAIAIPEKPFVLRGKVFTSESKENLSFATISVSNTSIGTYSDESGVFVLEVPSSKLNENIIVNYIGYRDYVYSIKELEESFLLIELSESKIVIEEIEILNREKPIKIDSRKGFISLNDFQINNLASGINGLNIFRNMQLLPGIVAHNDNKTELEVRGSNGDATLTLINNIPIYKSSHYFGLFSTVNSLHLDSVNIYRTVFPLKYSGKTGGIAEMFTKDDIPEKLSFDADLNMLSIELGLKTKVTDNSALYISGKRSTSPIGDMNIFSTDDVDNGKKNVDSFKDRMENNNATPELVFNDYQLSYVLKPNKKFSSSLNAHYSDQKYENNNDIFIRNNNNDSIRVNVEEAGSYQNLGVSLSTNYFPTKNIKYTTNTYNSFFTEENDNFARIRQKRSDSNNNNEILLDGNQENTISEFGHNQQLIFSKNNANYLFGIDYKNYQVSYSFEENRESVIRSQDQINKYGIYTSITNSTGRFTYDIGARVNYFSEINSFLFSPRILLSYDLKENFSIKASYAFYQQAVRQLFFEYRTIPMQIWTSSLNNNIPILTNNNFMLGGIWKNDFFSIDIEAYYKKLDGLTEFVVLNPEDNNHMQNQARDYMLFTGDGRIFGTDIMFISGFKNYETFICYTLSKSDERYKEINNFQYYSSENDRRHQLKWINSYVYRKFTFNLNAFYSSGRTYTRLNSVNSSIDITKRNFENRFNRLPDYRRIDASISYKFNITHNNTASISASVFNLLNTQNVKYIQSIVTGIEENGIPVSTVVGHEVTLLNRTFNINFRISL